MINLSILGSTGSIGTQALDIAEMFDDKINITAISGNQNIDLLEKQIKKFKPKLCAVMDKEKSKILKNRISSDTKILSGLEGLTEVASNEYTDTVLTAVSGIVGLVPTVSAIESNKRIALANKETLVAGGSLITKLAKDNNIDILPVDSEHSAIFQCLQGNDYKTINKIILTASGGPFLNKDKDFLKEAEVEDALNHPNWSMGKKITIDSATLMNKGLEMIEAYWLFNVDYENIEVVVHPESIIHSAVEFVDKSIIAQMGLPDMRLPIQYALFYPNRMKNNLKSLDFFEINQLNFIKPNTKIFRCLELAYDAIKIGGSMPSVLNVANEIAVDKFLKNEISFLDISTLIEEVMNQHRSYEIRDIEGILNAKKWTEGKIKEIHL